MFFFIYQNIISQTVANLQHQKRESILQLLKFLSWLMQCMQPKTCVCVCVCVCLASGLLCTDICKCKYGNNND